MNLGVYCSQALPGSQAADKAKVLLEGAIAAVKVFPETRPDSVKPVLSWDQKVSRRALFTLPPVRYEPVASIRREDCNAPKGCRVCATTCPREALEPSEERIMVLDKSRCTGCGACVSVCPEKAVDLPGASPQQIDARVTALLKEGSPAIGPRGVLFACADGISVLEELAQKGGSYPSAWLPVEVPCIGMVTPAWHLQALNLGAVSVGILPCGGDNCRFGKREIIQGRVDYSRQVLDLVGDSSERVKLLDPSDEAGLVCFLTDLSGDNKVKGSNYAQSASLFTPRATTEALLGIGEKYGASCDEKLDHPHSPVGSVDIGDGCTACGTCASVCPTGSIALERDQNGLALTFDAQLCIGCGECAPLCPEKVVTAKRTTDFQRLKQGKSLLYRSGEARCKTCGGPIAPQEMLNKIASLLGNDPALGTITKYCLSCRGALTQSPE
jgi:ferredoxin